MLPPLCGLLMFHLGTLRCRRAGASTPSLTSSDSDFTRLAQGLREGGFAVYGFGESRTPHALRSACRRFEIVGKAANGAAAAAVSGA